MPRIITREQLKEIRSLHKNLEHAMERRAFLFEKATGTAIDMSGEKVKTSPTDKHALLMAALADLDTEIERKAEDLRTKKEKALRVFAEAGFESEENEIMYYRYIACLDWRDITEIMFWSRSYVLRKHGTALHKLDTLRNTKKRA